MIIPAGYAHVVHRFSGNPLPEGAAVTHGVSLPGVLPIDEAAETIVVAWSTFIMPRMNSNILYEGATVKAGPNDDGPYVDWPASQAGGVASGATPPNTSYLVQKRTALGGRKNRGRMFIPSPAEVSVDAAGNIDVSDRQAMQNAVDVYYDALVTASLPMVVLHSGVQAPTFVTGLFVDSKVATQRRRLR